MRRLVERAGGARRCADDQRVVGKLLAFGDERAGADQAVLPDPGTVEQDRPHADQAVIADRAPVQHDVVADDAIGADHQGKAGIGVQRGIVLHLAALADLDPFVVAAQDRAEPNAGEGLEPHASDHRCILGDPAASVRRQLGGLTVKLVVRQAVLPGSARCRGDASPRQAAPWRRTMPQAARYAKNCSTASTSISTTVPDIMLQKPARTVASMTNSNRRATSRRARIVLRMMMKGAAKMTSGSAASARWRGPRLIRRKLAGRSVTH